MPPGIIAAAVPALIGGASSLLAGHSANQQAKRQYDAQQEQAQHAYNMQLYKFKQGLKQYDLKRGLAKNFITAHGLNPGNDVMDYLNAPDPTAPDFASVGGSTYRGGPGTDFSKMGGSAAAAAAKMFAPKPATGTEEPQSDPTNTVGQYGMAPTPAATPNPGVDIEGIINGEEKPK